MSTARNLGPDSWIARGAGFLEAAADGEVIALNRDEGRCYGLNRTGSRVWALIAGQVRIGDICTRLVSEYRVEPSVCERQVLDLLEELRTEGLIQTREAP